MKKFIFLLLSLFFITGKVFAAANNSGAGTVKRYSGTVTDTNGDALASAAVMSRTDPYGYPCTTNSQGFFDCKFPDSKVSVRYMSTTKDVDLSDDGNNSIQLDTVQYLEQATVVADRAGGLKLVMRKSDMIDSSDRIDSDVPVVTQPNLAQQLCTQVKYNGEKGQWNKTTNKCDCPGTMLWNVNMQKCEDATISALQDACWKIRKQATWNDDEGKCVCNSDKDEYKDGKCVKKENEPEEKSKPDTEEKNIDTRTDEQKAADLAEKQSAYESARATEQSTANKLLGGLTTAATGIGTMEALRGLAEQQADKKADTDMDAYIATMRCSYADGKSVKAGLEPIELPGGNDENLMKYRNEYIALATSLKTRKESLGMKPGIESELILDKADMGLYDQENVGITDGSYSSLYRAKLQNSETDQTQIAEETKKSGNRLKYGAIAAGVGVAGGIIGNSAINGKLNEMIKEVKGKISNNRTNRDTISALKKGLESAGLINVNDLDFSKLDLSGMQDIMNKIDFSKMASGLKGKSATEVLNTSNKASFISSFSEILGDKNASLFEHE